MRTPKTVKIDLNFFSSVYPQASLGFGSLMEYNGLAFAWTGQTFKRHWAIRMSFSIMYSAHRVGVSRVHELAQTQGEERATRGGRAAPLN